MKKGQAFVASIVGLIIALILVVSVALPVTTNQILPMHNLTVVTNETVSGYNGSYASLANYPVSTASGSGVQIRNATGFTTLTENRNYTWQAKDTSTDTANGTIKWIGLQTTWNSSSCDDTVGVVVPAPGICTDLRVTYGYQTQTYQLIGSPGRTVMALFPLFLVLLGLIVIATMLIRSLK